jgi:hypothetical protein
MKGFNPRNVNRHSPVHGRCAEAVLYDVRGEAECGPDAGQVVLQLQGEVTERHIIRHRQHRHRVQVSIRRPRLNVRVLCKMMTKGKVKQWQ